MAVLVGLSGTKKNPGPVKHISEVTVALERWEAWAKEKVTSTGRQSLQLPRLFVTDHPARPTNRHAALE